jgi:NSS family neurotransmitter:Na+ symporter
LQRRPAVSARQTQRFSSHLATLLTMAGLAIGLGNVWRFPYMMGQHGGSAFLAAYLLCMVLLAVPALACEWSLGRATRSGPVASYRLAYGQRLGLVIGLTLLFSVFMALCYYSIIVANVFYSMGFAAVQGFSADGLAAYRTGLGNHGLQYLLAVGVVLTSVWVVHRGLRRGIELMNRLLVPLFGLIALYLVAVALNLEGAVPRLLAYLRPDFSELGADVWFAAMGQACFSVGLSGVLHVMYGSYLAGRERPVATALTTSLMDCGAAFMATLFVVPAALVFGLSMAAGPGLLFDTLPRLFAIMPGGRPLAALFLMGWAMVAMLTIIATFDAVITGLSDLTGKRLGRPAWTTIVTAAVIVFTLPIAWNPHWIGTLDLLFGSGMFMVGSLLAVVGVGWGLGRTTLSDQLRPGLPPALATLVTGWARYVVPLALAAILAGFVVSAM